MSERLGKGAASHRADDLLPSDLSLLPRDLALATAPTLDAMPRKGPLPTGLFSASPKPSERLLWIFHGQSLLWRTFDRVGNICSEAGAEAQWQQFSETLLRCFYADNIGQDERAGQDKSNSLIQIAQGLEWLIKHTPPPVASAVQTKIVCLLHSLFALSHAKIDRVRPCRTTRALLKESTMQ